MPPALNTRAFVNGTDVKHHVVTDIDHDQCKQSAPLVCRRHRRPHHRLHHLLQFLRWRVISCFAATSVADSNSSTADADVLWRYLLPEPSNVFFAEYGTVQWFSSGWTFYSNARVSSKASLNLVGNS